MKLLFVISAVVLLGACNQVPAAGSGPARPSAPAPAASPVTQSGSSDNIHITEKWACSANLNITIHSPGGSIQTLTAKNSDFKPSWSMDGTKITFFRAYRWGANLKFEDWRSSICVINADGTGFRELTTAEAPNFNPTWTRDGSNMIMFNREGKTYWISPAGSQGDEKTLSDPGFKGWEWVTGGLKDGRLFVDRIDTNGAFHSYLLTPSPGEKGRYEEIQRPTDLYWHKLSISPSETRVAYMLDHNYNIATYNDVAICYADFDVRNLKISNQVIIAGEDRSCVREYPCWNRDETLILYDSNRTGTSQIYAYRLADGMTSLVSPMAATHYNFADFEAIPK